MNQNLQNILEIENEKLKKENKVLKSEIKKYEQKIEELKKSYKIGIEKLINDHQELEKAINGDTLKIIDLKKYGVIGEFLNPKDNLIKINPETNQIIGNEKQIKKDFNFIDFYDVIINIKSIKDINEGWEVKLSKRAEEKYEIFKKDEIIKIGVIGNANKGKSFLLSKISKIDLPSGTSIRTEGLSIKYPEIDNLFKNRKIALLDSAGLETPVLKEEKIIEKKSEKEIFKEKSREKIITELFLQNYILNNSDILLLVVGILTYSEQKLINRIKLEMQRAKIIKPLYIIHNLITYTTIDQVKEYIDTILLKSLTFKLVEGHNIGTEINKESKTFYYSEGNNIFHLIFANEGSEAGKYYNELTLKFIENSYQTVSKLTSFDVIESIKERFIEVSKEIFESIEPKFTKNDFDNSDNKKIKLNNQKEIILKRCLIDELGFSNLKGNGFEPTYNYYKKDDKIIVRVEAPGNCILSSTFDHSGEYSIIRLTGNKKQDKEPEKLEDNIFNSREFGEFSLDIPYKTEDYLIKNKEPIITQKKGLLILEFTLEEKAKSTVFSNQDDDV